MSMKRKYSDEELQPAAQRVANVYARIVNRKLGCKIPVPVPMRFDLEYESLTTAQYAGRAHATMRIDINMTIFRDNVEDILNDTIPHEMGHLVQFDRFDNKGLHTSGHGVYWQEVMRTMGKDPSRFHKLDVSKAIAAFKEHHKKTAKAKAKVKKEIEE